MKKLPQHVYDFRDAIDRLGSIATFSASMKFISIADSFTKLFGYTADDVQGRDLHFLDYIDAEPALSKQMSRQIHAGGTWIGDVTCRHKNGTPVETRISIAPSIHDGDVIGFVVQYQRSDAQPNRFEMADVLYRYRAGFNKIAALAVVSSFGEVKEVNDLFVEFYGYEKSEIIGKQISVLRSCNTSHETHTRLWGSLLNGQVWSEEIENRRKDGRSIFVRATVAPASSATLGVIASFDAFLVIYQDITLEQELRSNQNEIAIESARQQMLAGTLHNIGNLQQSVVAANDKTIQGAQNLVLACKHALQHYRKLSATLDVKGWPKLEEFINGVLGITQGSANQILDSAQVERKAIDDTISVLHSFRRHQKNIRPVDDESVSAFVQRTLNTFSLQAAQHHIAIWIGAMMEGDIRWPVAQVQQIVFNLLINAQEAICGKIGTGDILPHHGRIDISITQDGDNVVFCVKDNGGGFDVPLNQLFAPRFTTKTKGSGIGLHTSAIMAQSMGGSLTAENSDINGRRGALFILRLPRVIAAQGGISQ